ncbi:MAG: Macrolide export ATP-binding/permease protein MacB [Planctomycetota bacterium]|jgi:hypothetical protein
MIRMVAWELRHRWTAALVVALGIAGACVLGLSLRGSLAAFDRGSEARAAAHAAAVDGEAGVLEERMRKIMLGLGFNLAILPPDQPLDAFLAGQPPTAWMPEAWADRLAARRPGTINHLAPVLAGRIPWPELGGDALLMGVKGEVFIQSPSQRPIEAPIPAGACVVGEALASRLGTSPGGDLFLAGRRWRVAAIKAGRGGRDDATVWLPIADAQELLGRPGLISAIYGLECECGPEALAAIRREVHAVLPTVAIQQFHTLARTRDEVRREAKRAREALAAETAAAGNAERGRRQRLAILAESAAWAGAGALAALLAAMNVRERRVEIALLRAVGMPRRRIAGLVLLRTVVVAGAGAGAGTAAAAGVAAGTEAVAWPGWPAAAATVAAALAVALAAAALPAWIAASTRPALILRED